MKFEKSKADTSATKPEETRVPFPFMRKRAHQPEKLSTQKTRLLEEARLKQRAAFWKKVRGVIGQFFMILFVLAVIFSMIVVPLLIVFG